MSTRKPKNPPAAPAGAANPFAALPGMDALAPAMQSWAQMTGLSMQPEALAELQKTYVEEATELWNQAMQAAQPGGAKEAAPIKDRRFAAKDWSTSPAAAFTAQMYLLNARAMMQMAEQVQGDAKAAGRVRFAVQQWVDAMSPSNFLALNPEAQRMALESKGESLKHGMQQLLADIKQGHVSQTDESVFEVGRNVATTEGNVVFENELFQLIEYKPLTAKVHAVPMLFVPPCINKYYIMDLQPANSLIRYTVEQGHRLFVVSWRNADQSVAGLNWDDYIGEGAIKAIDVVQDVTGADKINTLGFCVGGTILATALGVLAARGQQPAASVTLLTTLIDFADTGVLDIFVDEGSVRLRELTLGDEAPGGPQLLKGQELATTFSFLRPNDLVWNYVVGNYLKGETPPAFDLLYWNSDSTNLPGPMYAWYLRHTYLQNELKIPGRLTVCGESLDLSAIEAPIYLYASREDHIVPWTGAYASNFVFSGDKRFVLGASGHIAGVINPPAAGKRNYWVRDVAAGRGRAKAAQPVPAEQWLDDATSHPGSWWTDWSNWLKPTSGDEVAAPKTPGGKGYKAIEPAPGRYVKAKAT